MVVSDLGEPETCSHLRSIVYFNLWQAVFRSYACHFYKNYLNISRHLTVVCGCWEMEDYGWYMSNALKTVHLVGSKHMRLVS